MNIDNPSNGSGETQNNPSELESQAKNDAAELGSIAKRDLGAIKGRAAEDVRDLQHEASAKIGEAAEEAKSFAVDQKSLAAGQIGGVAAAISKVAEELDANDQQTVGRYARDLASGLSSVGKTIEDRDVDDLIGIAQDFGRKQPVAFLGAAALAGFVASRFALASAHRRDSKPSSAPAPSAPEQPSGYRPAGSVASNSQSNASTVGGL